ncbi:MAG TPA: bifunctional precorrin-2 dehydrogenase/sirohydrochlorin ferrochelatase, partial [Acidimicrobiales bacterium]
GRRVLVVGGGRVAARKVAGLLPCGAIVTVVAPEIGPELAELDQPGQRDRFEVARRPYGRGEAASYDLVFTATSDAEVNQAVYDDAVAAGVWVNSADDPDRCSFVLPSVVRRGPITVTVSTGGHSPAMSVFLRRWVSDELGPEYEVLVTLLSEQRAALQAAGRATEGLDWQSALDSDMLDLVRAGQLDRVRERLKACLTSSS